MFQIQPQFCAGVQWEEIAGKYNLYYEVLEFSAPPFHEAPDDFNRCLDWYKETKKVHSLHGAFIDVNPGSGDPKFRSLSRERCRLSCEIAQKLGAKRVVFHSSAFPFLRGAYLDNWSGVCADFYTELAEDYGLLICIENSIDLDPVAILTILSHVQSDKVCVCLDIGHANYSNVSLQEWFEALGEHIDCMHLSDNLGRYDDHLILGEGNVDWKLADSLWRQLGRDMPFTLETGNISGVEKSLSYLRSHGYFIQEEA